MKIKISYKPYGSQSTITTVIEEADYPSFIETAKKKGSIIVKEERIENSFTNGRTRAEQDIQNKLTNSVFQNPPDTNDCRSFRKDTETCSSGCMKAQPSVSPGGICSFQDHQSDCPCYR